VGRRRADAAEHVRDAGERLAGRHDRVAPAIMLTNIVSFEIPVTRMEGKFKLNHGDKPERIRTAIEQLERQGETLLAKYMRRYNGS
jgi:predicted FMN-binding regulatory protein PaiB